MSSVKRYECFGVGSEMRETLGGGYYRADDYAALELECEETTGTYIAEFGRAPKGETFKHHME